MLLGDFQDTKGLLLGNYHGYRCVICLDLGASGFYLKGGGCLRVVSQNGYEKTS